MGKSCGRKPSKICAGKCAAIFKGCAGDFYRRSATIKKLEEEFCVCKKMYNAKQIRHGGSNVQGQDKKQAKKSSAKENPHQLQSKISNI
jgi:hypothetical protein